MEMTYLEKAKRYLEITKSEKTEDVELMAELEELKDDLAELVEGNPYEALWMLELDPND